MNICFCLFDDGLGFRYELQVENSLVYFLLKVELTEFAITGDHTAWWIVGDYDTQEYDYATYKLQDIRGVNETVKKESLSQTEFYDTVVQTSLQLKTDDGIYINLHVAALVNYGVIHLNLDDDNMVFKSYITPVMDVNKGHLQTPCNTPWRTCYCNL